MSNDLQQAINAIKAGDRETGQQLLQQAITADPQNEAAWQWMANTLDDPQEKKECLQRVLQFNPDNETAKQALAQLEPPSESVELPRLDGIASEVTKKCPYCSETTKAEAVVCRYCGRDLIPEAAQQIAAEIAPPKKWYLTRGFLILTFLFATPLWTLIVLDDPAQTAGVRALATILLVVYVVFICVLLASGAFLY